MAQPSTRAEFREWCLRKLGKNAIEINVDPDQVEDRIDEALEYWREFHSDAVQKTYMTYEIQAADIVNKYIPMNEDVISVLRIWPMSSSLSGGNINMFDLRYQIRLNDFISYRATEHLDYYLIQQYLSQVDELYVGVPKIEFNKHTDRIVPYMNWDTMTAGEYIMIECYVALDEDTYSDIWSDRMLQKLATAYIKLQWGNNMKKYSGVQLLGGMTMDGQTIYTEAMDEIEKIEQKIRDEFEFPPAPTIF